MRVTQSMLSNSNLKYISQSYNRFGKLQDQLNSGKKITRPSDDPVVAMKGMRYRSQVVEIDQFRRNLNEGFNWLDNSDSALDETGQVLNRVRDLVVQASNDSYNEASRKNIEKEISRLQEHLVAMANSRVGENYIFNGTDTAKAPINESLFNVDFNKFSSDLAAAASGSPTADAAPDEYVISYNGQTYKYDKDKSVGNVAAFTIQPEVKYKVLDANGNEVEKTGPSASLSIDFSGSPATVKHTQLEEQKNLNGAMIETTTDLSSNNLVISNKNAVSTNNQDVEIEVMKGVKIPININSQDAFSIEMFSGLESIKKMLTDPTTKATEITKALDSIDGYLDDIVSTRAELGAQINRAEMVDSRLLDQKVVAKKTVSENEDIDFEEAIINLTIQESVHRASLAIGARIIQPTLMDFLR